MKGGIDLDNKNKVGSKIFRIISISVFALGLLISGLTLAFYSSTDQVTNKQTGNEIKIELIEPQWYDHGAEEAKTLEPGMIIDKDPQIYNDSETAVYVRLRLKITDSSGSEIDFGTDRYNKIVTSLYIQNDDGDTKLVSISDTGAVTSQNPDFEFIPDSEETNEGWFYYKSANGYTMLDSKVVTPELFSCIKIPVLKTDYNGYFDSYFDISVEAQAISAGGEYEDIQEQFKLRYEDINS